MKEANVLSFPMKRDAALEVDSIFKNIDEKSLNDLQVGLESLMSELPYESLIDHEELIDLTKDLNLEEKNKQIEEFESPLLTMMKIQNDMRELKALCHKMKYFLDEFESVELGRRI